MREPTPNRDELRRLLKRVDDLLTDENYHPGLLSWIEMYRRNLLELKEWINS